MARTVIKFCYFPTAVNLCENHFASYLLLGNGYILLRSATGDVVVIVSASDM